MFLQLEKHRRDRSNKKYYFIWIDGPGAVDGFLKNFLFDNCVMIGVRKNGRLCWLTKRGEYGKRRKGTDAGPGAERRTDRKDRGRRPARDARRNGIPGRPERIRTLCRLRRPGKARAPLSRMRRTRKGQGEKGTRFF